MSRDEKVSCPRCSKRVAVILCALCGGLGRVSPALAAAYHHLEDKSMNASEALRMLEKEHG